MTTVGSDAITMKSERIVMLSGNFGFKLLVLCACSVIIGGPAWGGTFDGVWTVKQVCPRAPDGALGYTYNYTVTVRDDALDGEHIVPNNNGSIRLHGTIGPDGTAYLNADGVTGPSQYAVKGVAKGSPVHYHVSAKFYGSRGSGWM